MKAADRIKIQPQLTAAVRQHALDHYEEGWDEVVEAWDNDFILFVIGEAETPAGAIRKAREVVQLRNEVAADIRATAF